MSNNTRPHPLDRLIADDFIFILEAIIPFVDFKLKKIIFLFLKYKETILILGEMDNHENMEKCGLHIADKSKENMIERIFEFVPNDLSNNLKEAKQMISMFQMMQMMNEMNSDASGNDDFYDSNMFDDTKFNDTLFSDIYDNTDMHDVSNNEISSQESLFDSIINILDNNA